MRILNHNRSRISIVEMQKRCISGPIWHNSFPGSKQIIFSYGKIAQTAISQPKRIFIWQKWSPSRSLLIGHRE